MDMSQKVLLSPSLKKKSRPNVLDVTDCHDNSTMVMPSLTSSISPQPLCVPPETEDGVQTDTGQVLERGGNAGLLRAHCPGPAGLHRGQGRFQHVRFISLLFLLHFIFIIIRFVVTVQ